MTLSLQTSILLFSFVRLWEFGVESTLPAFSCNSVGPCYAFSALEVKSPEISFPAKRCAHFLFPWYEVISGQNCFDTRDQCRIQIKSRLEYDVRSRRHPILPSTPCIRGNVKTYCWSQLVAGVSYLHKDKHNGARYSKAITGTCNKKERACFLPACLQLIVTYGMPFSRDVSHLPAYKWISTQRPWLP